jgi:hypothetical protein
MNVIPPVYRGTFGGLPPGTAWSGEKIKVKPWYLVLTRFLAFEKSSRVFIRKTIDDFLARDSLRKKMYLRNRKVFIDEILSMIFIREIMVNIFNQSLI